MPEGLRCVHLLPAPLRNSVLAASSCCSCIRLAIYPPFWLVSSWKGNVKFSFPRQILEITKKLFADTLLTALLRWSENVSVSTVLLMWVTNDDRRDWIFLEWGCYHPLLIVISHLTRLCFALALIMMPTPPVAAWASFLHADKVTKGLPQHFAEPQCFIMYNSVLLNSQYFNILGVLIQKKI